MNSTTTTTPQPQRIPLEIRERMGYFEVIETEGPLQGTTLDSFPSYIRAEQFVADERYKRHVQQIESLGLDYNDEMGSWEGSTEWYAEMRQQERRERRSR